MFIAKEDLIRIKDRLMDLERRNSVLMTHLGLVFNPVHQPAFKYEILTVAEQKKIYKKIKADYAKSVRGLR